MVRLASILEIGFTSLPAEMGKTFNSSSMTRHVSQPPKESRNLHAEWRMIDKILMILCISALPFIEPSNSILSSFGSVPGMSIHTQSIQLL